LIYISVFTADHSSEPNGVANKQVKIGIIKSVIKSNEAVVRIFIKFDLGIAR
jgi:hypothetical protein